MKKIIVLIFVLLYVFTAYAQLNKEQKTIQQTFFNFLQFYKGNQKKFNTFRLYKGTGKDHSPPYKIQWKEAEKYFSFLQTSVPYVGQAYINAERNYFKYYDSCYKANPEEEMPVGFDFDRWAGGQEDISYTIKWYTSAKNKYLITINGNTAQLKIGAELMEGTTEKDRSWSIVPFVKEKGKWVMADNIYPADETEN
jgi:hypothetical protein